MEFGVNMVYEEEDFFSLAELSIKSKKGYIFGRIFGIVIGVMWFASMASALVFTIKMMIVYGNGIPIANIIMYLAFIYLSCILIFGTNAKKTSKRMWKQYEDKGSEVKFLFTEDFVLIETAKTEEKAKYTNFKKIYDYKERYLLFINNFSAHIIRKDKFDEEERENFEAFIQRKTNRKIITK